MGLGLVAPERSPTAVNLMNMERSVQRFTMYVRHHSYLAWSCAAYLHYGCGHSHVCMCIFLCCDFVHCEACPACTLCVCVICVWLSLCLCCRIVLQPFGKEDTVGCLIDLDTFTIAFTKNGGSAHFQLSAGPAV